MSDIQLKKVHRLPGDEFFREGDQLCSRNYRMYASDSDIYDRSLDEYICQEENCQSVLVNKVMFEIHYANFHQHTCRLCKRNFPTNYLLVLHIQENHDSFFKLRMDKQNFPYECIVEGCSIRFNDQTQRKLHLLNDHFYPNDFKFAQI